MKKSVKTLAFVIVMFLLTSIAAEEASAQVIDRDDLKKAWDWFKGLFAKEKTEKLAEKANEIKAKAARGDVFSVFILLFLLLGTTGFLVFAIQKKNPFWGLLLGFFGAFLAAVSGVTLADIYPLGKVLMWVIGIGMILLIFKAGGFGPETFTQILEMILRNWMGAMVLFLLALFFFYENAFNRIWTFLTVNIFKAIWEAFKSVVLGR